MRFSVKYNKKYLLKNALKRAKRVHIFLIKMLDSDVINYCFLVKNSLLGWNLVVVI